MKKYKSNLLLILAAFIWGAAFSAQSVGMEYVGPFTFNGVRFIIGGIVLLPVIFISGRLSRQRTDAAEKSTESKRRELKKLLFSGCICGILLALASSLQQIGLLYTTPGKAGFITALYVILVPLFGTLLGQRSGILIWISAILAVIGMYLLCLSGVGGINAGDVLVLICAVCFSFHILTVDRLAPSLDGIKLSCVQFFTAGIICSVIMFITESPDFSSLLDAAIPLLYTGVLSCGVAYTLQIVGQKSTPPTIASLLLSLESVFSVLTAWIVLGASMSTREIIGCCIVFCAIILAQLPKSLFTKDRNK